MTRSSSCFAQLGARIKAVLDRASPERIDATSMLWGADYVEKTGYIRRYVWHLRRKLEQDPQDPRYILNERSVGYVFPVD